MTPSSPKKPSFLARCVPAVGWLRSYDRQWLRGDVVPYGLGMLFSLKTHRELFASAKHDPLGSSECF